MLRNRTITLQGHMYQDIFSYTILPIYVHFEFFKEDNLLKDEKTVPKCI